MIDVQGRLAEIVDRSDEVRANVVRLIRGTELLELQVHCRSDRFCALSRLVR